MAETSVWDDFVNSIGLGTTTQPVQPEGYSNLTSSQVKNVDDQGYYNRSDVVQPTSQETSTGTVTNDVAGDQQKSIWDRLATGLGSPEGEKALGKLANAFAPPKPLTNLAPPIVPERLGAPSPYFNPWRRSSLNPSTAFKSLLSGGFT